MPLTEGVYKIRNNKGQFLKGHGIPLFCRFVMKYKISNNGCWEWKGATRNGYGVIGLGTREDGIEYAHRISYQFFVGDIPETKHILHHCDNRSCINPQHIYAGTRSDNIRDAYNRGRRKSKQFPIKEIF